MFSPVLPFPGLFAIKINLKFNPSNCCILYYYYQTPACCRKEIFNLAPEENSIIEDGSPVIYKTIKIIKTMRKIVVSETIVYRQDVYNKHHRRTRQDFNHLHTECRHLGGTHFPNLC